MDSLINAFTQFDLNDWERFNRDAAEVFAFRLIVAASVVTAVFHLLKVKQARLLGFLVIVILAWFHGQDVWPNVNNQWQALAGAILLGWVVWALALLVIGLVKSANDAPAKGH